MERFGIVISAYGNSDLNRRDFLKHSVVLSGGLALTGLGSTILSGCKQSTSFKISLAEWSLHRSIQNGEIDHLDFCSIANNKFGISLLFTKSKNIFFVSVGRIQL